MKHDDGESQEGQKIKRELNKGYQHRNRKEGQRKLHVLQNLVIQKFFKKGERRKERKKRKLCASKGLLQRIEENWKKGEIGKERKMGERV